MKVKALDQFDGFKKGEMVDLPLAYAQGVIEKGLAKMADEIENKMAPAYTNKAAKLRQPRSSEGKR
jgi:hypothetical protein